MKKNVLVVILHAFVLATLLAFVPMAAQAQGEPEYHVNSMTISPAVHTPGGAGTLTLVLANTEIGTATSFVLSVWFDRASAPDCGDAGSLNIPITSLPAFSTLTVAVSFTFSATAGAKTARAFPDSTCAVIEVDDSNNQTELSYTVGPTTYTVTNTADSGAGSLRQAITDANANPGPDNIFFNISGAGSHTITPSFFSLPDITESVTIDATTQPGFAGTPIIEIDASGVNSLFAVFEIPTTNVTIRGLVINGNDGPAVEINGAGASGNVITGNYFGTNVEGDAAVGSSVGVEITNGAFGNVIGGTQTGAGNVFAGADTGVDIYDGTGNVVQGNYIGTNAAGTGALGNTNGVVIQGYNCTGNLIGGTQTGAGNLISGNTDHGIWFYYYAYGNFAQGNYVGVNASGTGSISNGYGIGAGLCKNNFIGGTQTGAGNLISGNNYGVYLYSGGSLTTVQGNFIGTNFGGTSTIPNAHGVVIEDTPFSLIGGTDSGARNVIAGNTGKGVSCFGAASTNTVIQGNFIGTDVTGTSALGNNQGIVVNGPIGTRIGGTQTGAGNIVAGSAGEGILVKNASFTYIQGNYAGTDVTGTNALPNDRGIVVNDAANVLVGGTQTGAGNLVSGNTNAGISVPGASLTTIQGNYVGTNAGGTASIANLEGIHILNARLNLIGGTASGARNITSGNTLRGIYVEQDGGDAHGNVIQGNYVGTDATGTSALGNSLAGIHVANAENTLIGGTLTSARNVVSGNGDNAIALGSSNNIIQGNYIGTNAAGTGSISNNRGIQIAGSFNKIGGTETGAENVIANGAAFSGGVNVVSGTQNLILSNSIYNNNGIGIDLDNDGVSPNFDGDNDSGPNNLQNFPVLLSAVSSGGTMTVTGSLNSASNTTFRIEFFANPACDASGNGEGKVFVGATTITTNGSNVGTFSVVFPSPALSLTTLATTATDPDGNTSEFSACQAITALSPDLQVTNVTLTPPVGLVGSDGTLTVTIFNGGTGPANNFTLSVFFDEPGPIDCGSIGNINTLIPTLASGASLTQDFPFAFLSLPGSSVARAFVDSNCIVDESDETNNQGSVSFISAEPDLVVTSLTLNKSSYAPREVGTATVTIKNIGSVSTVSDFDVQLYRNAPKVVSCATPSSLLINQGSLAAGASVTFPMTFMAPTSAGTFTVRIFADGSCALTESNESNNQSATSYTVPLSPDLVVETLTLNKSSYAPREAGTATVTIKNIGSASTVNNFDVKLYRHGPSVVNCATLSSLSLNHGSLAAGASATFSMAFAAPSSVGTFTVRVFADGSCSIPESVETNNQSSMSYAVTSSPDLIVETLILNKGTYSPLETGTAAVTIKNIGSVSTVSGFDVKLYRNGPSPVNCATLSSTVMNIGALAAGASVTFPMTFVTSSNAGTFTVRVFADGSCSIAESAEANNQTTMPYTVESPAASALSEPPLTNDGTPTDP